MIIEQAFVGLPELLLGNHCAVQEYESGLVGVLSLAILQELNGRNVAHPIRHLQAERRYNAGSPRRVDLHVNLEQLTIANQRLENYGWRHFNWVETKFYRNKSPIQRHSTMKATHQGQLITDLIRLTCLVPLTLEDRDPNGRYFLHIYDDVPKFYLPYDGRNWVESLHQAGRQDIVIDQLADESSTAKKQFGENLQRLQLQATVTNMVNFPLSELRRNEGTQYWCVLTRIDAFSVTLDDRWFQVHANQVARENAPGDYLQIARTVSDGLGSAKVTENTP